MKPKVVLICGLPGSGKTTLGHILAQRFEFIHLEVSRIVKEIYDLEKKAQESAMGFVQRVLGSPSDVSKFALQAASESDGYFARGGSVVVTGLRKPQEVRAFKQIVPNAFVVYLHCDFDTRRARKPEVDPLTGFSFTLRDQLEREWNCPEVEEEADISINTKRPIEDCVLDIQKLLALR